MDNLLSIIGVAGSHTFIQQHLSIIHYQLSIINYQLS